MRLNNIVFGYNCTIIYIFTFFVSCLWDYSFKLTIGKIVLMCKKPHLEISSMDNLSNIKAHFAYYWHFNIQQGFINIKSRNNRVFKRFLNFMSDTYQQKIYFFLGFASWCNFTLCLLCLFLWFLWCLWLLCLSEFDFSSLVLGESVLVSLVSCSPFSDLCSLDSLVGSVVCSSSDCFGSSALSDLSDFLSDFFSDLSPAWSFSYKVLYHILAEWLGWH